MALSYVTYTATGSTDTFSIPFAYLDTAHVSVKKNGVTATFSWLTSASIQLSSTPANGDVIVIRRTTPKTPLFDSNDGAVLTNSNLQTLSKQNIYLSEEANDYADDATATAIDSGTAAAASASAAAASETAAAASETAAAASVTAAAAQATAAASSATAAAGSATAANTAKLAAEAAAGALVPSSNIAWTGNNTHAGVETFNGATRIMGGLGIGRVEQAGLKVAVAGALGGLTTTCGYANQPVVQSDSTAAYRGFFSAPSTQAAAFNIASLRHYEAYGTALGAGSSIGNQYGFVVEGTLTQGTYNFGYYSGLAANAGYNWAFYAASTAPSYFGGDVTIGTDARLLGIGSQSVQTFLGPSSVNLATYGVVYDVVNTGSIGAAGQVWEITFYAAAYNTATSDSVEAAIYDGTSYIAAYSGYTVGTQGVMLVCSKIVTLTGATTFTGRAKAGNTNSYIVTTGNASLVANRATSIVAKRLA